MRTFAAMSQHEIEDLVSESIRALHDRHTGVDHRDLFFALYTFQAGFDCGFTHGRVLEILIERRFTYRLPFAAHPRYGGNEAAFAAAASEIAFVHSEVLGLEFSDDDARPAIGNEDGYLAAGALHCDAGTPLWRDLVAAGVLTGSDALPPRAPPLGAIALCVARAAPELAPAWLELGPRLLFPRTRRVVAGDVLGVNPFTGAEVIAPTDRELVVEPGPADLADITDAVALRDLCRRLHVEVDKPRESWSAAEAWLWG